MTPTADFGNGEKANGTLSGRPQREQGQDVADLPVVRIWDSAGYSVTSCWRCSWRDRLRILFTGRVYLSVLGKTHAPVRVHSKF
jgi:hypothetical protein